MAKEDRKDGDVTRRTFFKSVVIGIGSFLTVLIGFPMIDSLVSGSKSLIKKTFDKLGPLSGIQNSFMPEVRPTKLSFTKIEKDAFIRLKEPEQVWVVKKSAKDIVVFSPICPHLGCRYNWDAERKLFVCPCHNSVYTIEGKVVSGPAPRGLDELPIEVKDENLYVKYEKFEVGIPDKIIIG